MFIRTSRVSRNGKTYEYRQLVESFRRPDGIPSHRVVASLHDWPPDLVRNLELALAAVREGTTLVVPAAAASRLTIEANLRFLDLAVLHRLWVDTGLHRLLASALPSSAADVSVVEVVTALMLQRCVAPASKLAAVKWFPTTALPELLNIGPAQFHNSRLHRAMSMLDRADSALQDGLVAQAKTVSGAFTALFADITDTWFVGDGPASAGKGIDKEGVYRTRVGIALLCDQHGFPLRWQMLPGTSHDATELSRMVHEVARLPWVGETPLIVDSALGNAQAVDALFDLRTHFLVALHIDEAANYSGKIPWDSFPEIALAGTPERWKEDVAAATHAARGAGFVPTPDGRLVYDLHVFDKGEGTPKGPRPRREGDEPSPVATALAIAQQIARADAGENRTALAKKLSMSRATLNKHILLLSLNADLQARILVGEADRLRIGEIEALSQRPSEEQESAFDLLLATTATRPLQRRHPRHATGSPLRLRGVLVFSPIRFVKERTDALRCRAELDDLVGKALANLADPLNRKMDHTLLLPVTDYIRRHSFSDVVSATVTHQGDGGRGIGFTWNEAMWLRKRRTDGLTFLVGHAELRGTAAEIAALYTARDHVEKDFQSMKSVFDLHPIRHHTDPKVRAHVTLCMLALFLARTMELRLRNAGTPRTLPAVVETLRTCHLNRLANASTTYLLTKPTAQQQSLLATLGMDDLPNEDWLTDHIFPR